MRNGRLVMSLCVHVEVRLLVDQEVSSISTFDTLAGPNWNKVLRVASPVVVQILESRDFQRFDI